MRAALLAMSLCGLTPLSLAAQERVTAHALPPSTVANTAAATLSIQTQLSFARPLSSPGSLDGPPLYLVGRFLSAGNEGPPHPRHPSALQTDNLSHLLQW